MSEEAASDLLAVRRRKLEALREAGIDPVPYAYPDVTPIAEAKRPHEGLEPGEETDVRVFRMDEPGGIRRHRGGGGHRIRPSTVERNLLSIET